MLISTALYIFSFASKFASMTTLAPIVRSSFAASLASLRYFVLLSSLIAIDLFLLSLIVMVSLVREVTVPKQVLAYLLNMARLGRSPALYAELSIEQVDMHGDQASAKLIQELVIASNFETWFATLEKPDPTLVTQRPWFLEYFETMRDAIAGRSQPDPANGLE